MSQVIDYLVGKVKQCQTFNIRATMDVRSVNPPCVLFAPPSMELNVFHGASATFRAVVLVPGPGNLDAFALLDALAQDVVRNVLTDVERISPAEYAVDDGSSYPALQLEWTHSLDWPDPVALQP